MRAPHHFLTGNLILRTPSEAWAIYELEGQSYSGLPDARKVVWPDTGHLAMLERPAAFNSLVDAFAAE